MHLKLVSILVLISALSAYAICGDQNEQDCAKVLANTTPLLTVLYETTGTSLDAAAFNAKVADYFKLPADRVTVNEEPVPGDGENQWVYVQNIYPTCLECARFGECLACDVEGGVCIGTVMGDIGRNSFHIALLPFRVTVSEPVDIDVPCVEGELTERGFCECVEDFGRYDCRTESIAYVEVSYAVSNTTEFEAQQTAFECSARTYLGLSLDYLEFVAIDSTEDAAAEGLVRYKHLADCEECGKCGFCECTPTETDPVGYGVCLDKLEENLNDDKYFAHLVDSGIDVNQTNSIVADVVFTNIVPEQGASAGDQPMEYDDDDEGLSKFQLAGVIAGPILGVFLIAAGYVYRRETKKSQELQEPFMGGLEHQ
eukprot:TRINITY_DN2856_c5_g1::TRINITY_DN2856_c5_g1_i1::g.6102::m.6102 TRINITY_DN2856_c5_g1::TRINITY_DN2856_c5_g1_i1::g.6102  ORF type:complete len:370 (-),score=98.95,Glycophorin_A/PF01102.13/0.24 TRINITY_DN2856_c5_g1_i1:552-1661(-)